MILTVTPNPCVDKTVYVDEIRLGEKHRSQRYGCVAGGKGTNVSRAVHALGHDTAAMLIVGGAPGQHVVDMVTHQDGVRCIPVWTEAMTRTITTVLEEPAHRQTPFFEPGPRVSEDEKAALLDVFTQHLDGVDAVTFNGTVPDPVLDDFYRTAIGLARVAGAKTVLDSYGPPMELGLETVPYMVKPNLEEAQSLVGFALADSEAQWKAVDYFHGRGVELVVLSLGGAGALVSQGGVRIEARPPAIQAINPVGSGDALVAGMAIGIAQGWSLEESARWGVAAGTANAMSWDIGHFSRDEVKHLAQDVHIQVVGK